MRLDAAQDFFVVGEIHGPGLTKTRHGRHRLKHAAEYVIPHLFDNRSQHEIL